MKCGPHSNSGGDKQQLMFGFDEWRPEDGDPYHVPWLADMRQAHEDRKKRFLAIHQAANEKAQSLGQPYMMPPPGITLLQQAQLLEQALSLLHGNTPGQLGADGQ